MADNHICSTLYVAALDENARRLQCLTDMWQLAHFDAFFFTKKGRNMDDDVLNAFGTSSTTTAHPTHPTEALAFPLFTSLMLVFNLRTCYGVANLCTVS